MKTKLPIVMFTGWAASNEIWSSLISELGISNEYFVYDLDMLCKLGTKTDSNHLDIVIQNLVSVLPEKFILVGWSLGGLLAQKVALTVPERVDKLIAIAATPQFVADDEWVHAVDAKAFTQLQQGVMIKPKKTRQHFIHLMLFGLTDFSRYIDDLSRYIPMFTPDKETNLLTGLSWLKEISLVKALPKIDTKSLMILGRDDALVPSQIREHLPANIQSHVIDGAAHIPWLTHPHQVASLAREFI